MTQITELASSQITPSDTLAVELVEADETPRCHRSMARQPTVLHPHRFPSAAETAARVFAAAAVRLAQLKRERKL